MSSTRFVVDLMGDDALVASLVRLVKQLDPRDPLYDIRQAHYQAANALDLALELQQRGRQLELLPRGAEQGPPGAA